MSHSIAAEDYVKSIYAHTEWQPKPITSTRLAQKLGLAASTVTEMVQKLVAAGLVAHEPYGAIELTEAGRALALRQVRRHRIVETWLVAEHGFAWDEVHDEAEVLEHAMSDRLVESLARALGDPARDPHGDPIPTEDGRVTIPRAVRLDAAADGLHGPIVRIDDASGAVLRRVEDAGVRLDARVLVAGDPAVRAIVVDGRAIDCDADVQRSLWIGLG